MSTANVVPLLNRELFDSISNTSELREGDVRGSPKLLAFTFRETY